MTMNQMREWIISRPRRTKRLMLVTVDFFSLVFIIWAAFCYRFNQLFIPNFEQMLFMVAGPVIAIPVFVKMGLYRAVLRYLRERALWTIFIAVSISSLIWVSMVFLTLSYGASGIPRTIAVLYWVGGFCAVAGSRFAVKSLLRGRSGRGADKTPVLIYGVGDAAVQLADALHNSPDRQVVGFISDDKGMAGMDIMGLRIYPEGNIDDLVANVGIKEVIIASTSAGPRRRRELVAKLGHHGLKIRLLPPLADLAAGRYLVSHIRDIDIDDLLGRSPVPADPELVREAVEGRTILVTGAAGSIGSAVCRAIAQANPRKLVLLEVNELGLYQIEREMRRHGFPVVPVLGTITDAAMLARTFRQHRIQTVYHCAAFKHVSLVEKNVLQGVHNNVFGTLALVQEAHAANVEKFVLISSDKAVRPSSVMGATKRWAELIVRHFGRQLEEKAAGGVYSSVRFGNVIGSSGSVVPLFKEQIAAGGPVTLTDDEMTRYFMSVREAAELIIQASTLSSCGDILLLDMGEPVRIRDLARDMVMLAGLTVRDEQNPAGDIEIVTIGMRDGEKLHEELFYDPVGVTPTQHPKILRAKPQNRMSNQVPAMLEALRQALETGDEQVVRDVLFGELQKRRDQQPLTIEAKLQPETANLPRHS